MIRYVVYQNQNEGKTECYKKWYARAVTDQTLDIAKLAKHMASHNTPYSAGLIKGVLTDMVHCIKEVLLDGKNVKIDDLAIFSVGFHCKGSDKLEDFNIAQNLLGMRLNARATGELSVGNLLLDTEFMQRTEYVKPGTETTPTTPTTPTDGGNTGETGGTGNTGGGGDMTGA